MFWNDLQEAFFIALAPVIFYLILPGLLAAGLLMAIARFIKKILSGPE